MDKGIILPIGNFFLLIINGVLILILLIQLVRNLLPAEQTSIIYSPEASATIWQFEAIDTMKFSRDPAREKLNDPSFDLHINKQMLEIQKTGATHVAIATPYDEEFLPFLKRWVKSAREHDLNVWFRGNWSGWEEWFEYPPINRAEHIKKTEEFILNNSSLFNDGDVFTACPECENGGPGDPRRNGDIEGHRKFLINEYNVTKKAFERIGKRVASNYNSMNGDVARFIMDPSTTRSLGGIVVVDHYVRTPETLEHDIKEFARLSQGKVVLGEFGAPIPDIHGSMSEEEQAAWLLESLSRISKLDELVGISYWTSLGGSTSLWYEEDFTPKKAVGVLTKYFNPNAVKGRVVGTFGEPIKDAVITGGIHVVRTDHSGRFTLPLIGDTTLTVQASSYIPQTIILNSFETRNTVIVYLERENPDILYQIRGFFRNQLNLPV